MHNLIVLLGRFEYTSVVDTWKVTYIYIYIVVKLFLKEIFKYLLRLVLSFYFAAYWSPWLEKMATRLTCNIFSKHHFIDIVQLTNEGECCVIIHFSWWHILLFCAWNPLSLSILRVFRDSSYMCFSAGVQFMLHISFLIRQGFPCNLNFVWEINHLQFAA